MNLSSVLFRGSRFSPSRSWQYQGFGPIQIGWKEEPLALKAIIFNTRQTFLFITLEEQVGNGLATQFLPARQGDFKMLF